MLERLTVVYFCDHSRKKFKSSDKYYEVDNIKEIGTRRHHKTVLFSCVTCHKNVSNLLVNNR